MRTVHRLLLPLALLLAAPADAQRGSHRYIWTDDGRTLEVRATGEFRFADDDRSLASLSPGGSLQVEERRAGVADRVVRWTATARDGVVRAYLEDGRAAAWDAEAEAWAARILPEVVREMGIGAEARVARLRAAGGVAGVLREVATIRSDGGASAHLRALLRGAPLSPGELAATLRTADRILESDGDRARVLVEAARAAPVDRDGAREAFFAAVDGTESDGDRHRVLSAVLGARELSEVGLVALLRSAARIESDGDKAAVLMGVRRERLRSDAVAEAYLAAVRSIESDGDRAAVARRLMEGRP